MSTDTRSQSTSRAGQPRNCIGYISSRGINVKSASADGRCQMIDAHGHVVFLHATGSANVALEGTADGKPWCLTRFPCDGPRSAFALVRAVGIRVLA